MSHPAKPPPLRPPPGYVGYRYPAEVHIHNPPPPPPPPPDQWVEPPDDGRGLACLGIVLSIVALLASVVSLVIAMKGAGL